MVVSVIVPIYNIEEYVERCVKSIIAQTYMDIQIILVIDGSQDESERICSRLAQEDSRIEMIVKENGGLSSARNAGLSLVKGDYVLFVDGDDWISENCIETCLPYMRSKNDIIMMGFIREYGHTHKSAFIFSENRVYEGKEKNILTRMLVGPIGEELKKPHTIEDINTAWGKLYRTDLIRNEKFIDTKVIGTEDLWFNLPVFLKA